MLIEIVVGLTSALLLYVAVYVALNFIRQHEANQFFKINSPDLPFIDELTSLYGGHANTIIYDPDNCKLIQKLHEKHGETVGALYGKNPVVSTLDLDFIKMMLIDEPYDHLDRPKPDIPFEEFEVDCIAFARDDQWRKLRQASAPAYTNHKIKAPNVINELEEIVKRFTSSIERRVKQAKEEKGRDFVVEDADDIFHRYTLAVVFKSFYKQDKIIDFDAKKDYYVDLIANTAKSLVNPLLVMSVVFPSLKPILQWLLMRFHPQGTMRNTIMRFIRLQTKQNFDARREFETAKKNAVGTFDSDNYYLKDGSKFSRNLSDHLIDQFHDGKLTKREYFHTAFFTFFAANKTSADSLTMLIYYLATHNQVQEKLRESILTNGVESEYLTWCINETLRLHPPAPIGSSRILTREYVTKAGHKIPANVIVHTPTYTIHRLKEYWGADAEEFRPERWSNSGDFHPCQFLAFGAGKRSCPGKSFAFQEIKMLMNALMRKFRIERSAETTDGNHFQSPAFIFTIFDKPHYVKISLV